MISKENEPFLVFCFSGQTFLYKNLVKELYNGNSIFRESIDKIDNHLKNNYYGESMLNKLWTYPENKFPHNDQYLVHSILLMIQISLFEVYKSEGIIPSIVFSLSCGETSTAYCSGMVDFETACEISYQRARLISKVETLSKPGTLATIQITPKEYFEKFSKKYPSIEISSNLAPTSVFLGCKDLSELDRLKVDVEEQGLVCRSFPFNIAFHTSAMDIIKEDTLKLNIKSKSPIIKYVSSIDGKIIEESNEPFYDENYLFKNIRNKVEFALSVEQVFKYIEKNGSNKVILVEISPGVIMENYIIESLKSLDSKLFNPLNNNNFQNNVTILSGLNKDIDDITSINKTISEIKKKLNQ
ncbi:hypothetical protein ACTA71_002049 [Dictyostelium dimigraforme]